MFEHNSVQNAFKVVHNFELQGFSIIIFRIELNLKQIN